jgi:hypothetical protein
MRGADVEDLVSDGYADNRRRVAAALAEDAEREILDGEVSMTLGRGYP